MRRASFGLSPRVRGNPAWATAGCGPRRSIPACAGEPGPAKQKSGLLGVYPRVCGGTSVMRCSPLVMTGLSPRVRGNQATIFNRSYMQRSIPACAGEPAPAPVRPWPLRVYPRVCGGTFICPSSALSAIGLSPRVRGNLEGERPEWSARGSIPACAGEPLAVAVLPRLDEVYPRVCGGTFSATPSKPTSRGLSPRVRGNLLGPSHVSIPIRSIPACAGEP